MSRFRVYKSALFCHQVFRLGRQVSQNVQEFSRLETSYMHVHLYLGDVYTKGLEHLLVRHMIRYNRAVHHLQWDLIEVAIQGSQHCLVGHDADTLALTLNLNDDRLQPLDDIQVTLPTWIPACAILS